MALTTKFDPLFARYAGRLPVPYLRALAKRESNLNPQSGGGSYWGILQVGYKNVLPSYNKRRGTNYSPNDLFDAEINVKIATDLLNRIVVAFGKHPSPNLQADWSNPEWVKLLTAGWNSGYSEAGGLGRVASWLEARGIPVTHDSVFKYAASAGATKYLQREQYDKKRRWQASVAELYFAQPDAAKGYSGLLALALVGFIAWGAYRLL
ncbi:MAG: transglycosylase SLT domain-containing protein [Deltaproteobacteria bacterium]|nr:transglycosylase SLT domain-containing protein [Deltaproteobacteria bacterium]